MSFLITLICFIFILGITVTIHEFGHFLFAKKAGIYVYEFSIGMGPRLKKFNRKNDETEYSIRLLPIGGYVQMAGEEVEADENIPKNKRLQSKTWLQRFMTMVAGVMFNFLLAIVVLFIIALIKGVTLNATYISESNVPGVEVGDKIVNVNGHFVNNYDKLALELTVAGKKDFNIKVKHKDGSYDTVKIHPKAVYEKKELKGYEYGFNITGTHKHSLLSSIQYAFVKFFNTVEQMFFTIWYLITGKISLKMLSGPVGIFSIVGQAASTGIMTLLSLLALISINVGFINLLPIPAFDGGHILFLIIEKIKGSPVNPKIENTVHTIFFVLLMILMLYITFNDVLKLF
jgi:regulator of sigma E protease